MQSSTACNRDCWNDPNEQRYGGCGSRQLTVKGKPAKESTLSYTGIIFLVSDLTKALTIHIVAVGPNRGTARAGYSWPNVYRQSSIANIWDPEWKAIKYPGIAG